MRQRSQKCVVDGTTFDSIAEACFYCWCVEAKDLDVIREFWLQPHWDLLEPVYYFPAGKSLAKSNRRTLLQGCGYTADFGVLVHRSADLGLRIPSYHNEDDCTYTIDIKGSFNKAASEFSLYQKLLWKMKDEYVNKVVVAYDTKNYGAKKCATGFFAMNGVPERLPKECYKLDGGLYAVWHRMFSGLPSIKEVHG